MRIELMKMNNYGPYYGEHEFQWSDRGLTIILGDNRDEPRMNSNGAGKSSIPDALDWCLFGVIPRKDHIDSVVNELAYRETKSKTVCSVVTELRDDDGSVIEISRFRIGSRTGLELKVNGEDRTTMDVKETQKLVIDLLGLDREIFHAAVLFAQTDLVRYADSSDADRMKVLSRVLQLEKIDDYLVWVKAQKAETESRLSKTKSMKLEAEQSAQALQESKSNLQTQSVEYALNRDQEFEALKQERDQIENKLHGLSEATSQLLSWKAALNQYQAELDNLNQPVAPVEYGDLKNKDDQFRDLLSKLVYKKKDAEAKIQKFEQIPDQCASCGQKVTPEYREQELKETRELLAQVNTEIAYVSEQRGLVHQKLSMIEDSMKVASVEFQKHVVDLYRKKAEAEAAIKTLTGQIGEVEMLRQSSANLQNFLERKKAETNPFLVQIEGVDRAISEKLDSISRWNTTIGELEHRLALLEFWVEGFGPKGLRSYILDSRLQEMTDAANEWVKLLTGGTMWVKFESQKRTRSNKLVNAPALIIAKWNPDGTISERNYNSWSGGQKRRIAFGVDFGLTRLLARRATKSYDLVILDEVFRNLDSLGKEAAVEMLEALAKEKNSVFGIEHDEKFESRFPNKVKVLYENMKAEIIDIKE